jgi:hypothetical protein
MSSQTAAALNLDTKSLETPTIRFRTTPHVVNNKDVIITIMTWALGGNSRHTRQEQSKPETRRS